MASLDDIDREIISGTQRGPASPRDIKPSIEGLDKIDKEVVTGFSLGDVGNIPIVESEQPITVEPGKTTELDFPEAVAKKREEPKPIRVGPAPAGQPVSRPVPPSKLDDIDRSTVQGIDPASLFERTVKIIGDVVYFPVDVLSKASKSDAFSEASGELIKDLRSTIPTSPVTPPGFGKFAQDERFQAALERIKGVAARMGADAADVELSLVDVDPDQLDPGFVPGGITGIAEPPEEGSLKFRESSIGRELESFGADMKSFAATPLPIIGPAKKAFRVKGKQIQSVAKAIIEVYPDAKNWNTLDIATNKLLPLGIFASDVLVPGDVGDALIEIPFALLGTSGGVKVAKRLSGGSADDIARKILSTIRKDTSFLRSLRIRQKNVANDIDDAVRKLIKNKIPLTVDNILYEALKFEKLSQRQLAGVENRITEELVKMSDDFKFIRLEGVKKSGKEARKKKRAEKLPIDQHLIKKAKSPQEVEEAKLAEQRIREAVTSRASTSVAEGIVVTGRRAVANQGAAGAELSRLMDLAWNNAEIASGRMSDEVDQILAGLNKKQIEEVGEILDPIRRTKKTAIQRDPKARVAAREIKKILKPLEEQLKKQGVTHKKKVGNKVVEVPFFEADNSFAHFIDFNDPRTKQRVLNKIVGKRRYKKGTSVDEKVDLAQIEINKYKNSLEGRTAGTFTESNLLSRKYGVTEYNKDTKSVLRSVIYSNQRRLHEAINFGADDEIADSLIKQIRIDGNNHDIARKVFDATYIAPSPVLSAPAFAKKAFHSIKVFNIWTKLGLAQLRNAQQSINTLASTDYTSMVLALRDTVQAMAKKNPDEFSRVWRGIIDRTQSDIIREAVGVAGDDVLHSGIKLSVPALKKGKGLIPGLKMKNISLTTDGFLNVTGFSTVETFNRLLAANAGKHWARRQAQIVKESGGVGYRFRNAIHELNRLGVSMEDITKARKTGEISTDALDRAAQTIVNQSQFRTGVMDLPLFWKTDFGRMIVQFKTFTMRHAIFVKDHIFAELNRGNPVPLAQFAAWAEISGITSQSIIDLARGKPLEETLLARLGYHWQDYNEGVEGASQALLQDLLIGFVSAGGFGLFTAVMLETFPEAEGRNVPAGRRAQSFMMGPAVDAATTATNAVRLGLTGDAPSGRALIKQLPVVGPFTESYLSPEKETIIDNFLRYMEEGVLTPAREEEEPKLPAPPKPEKIGPRSTFKLK